MCDILDILQDIFTKLVDAFLLTHHMSGLKLDIKFVCVFVSWFICSLKHGKVGYLGKKVKKSSQLYS